MSLQKIKQVIGKLSDCSAWSLQLLNARDIHSEFVYNAHEFAVILENNI